jgi:hypothetical protein
VQALPGKACVLSPDGKRIALYGFSTNEMSLFVVNVADGISVWLGTDPNGA